MKIAVPTDDRKTLAAHFGRATEFALYDVADGVASLSGYVRNEHTHGGEAHRGGEGHSHDFGGPLAGVNAVLCRGLGRRAQEAMAALGAEVIFTSEEELEEVAAKYARGELAAAERACGCEHDS